MRRCLLAFMMLGLLSIALPVQAQEGNSTRVYQTQSVYRTFGPPLPYRVYRPVYRPYAHGGRQGVGYVWGFPWVYSGD